MQFLAEFVEVVQLLAEQAFLGLLAGEEGRDDADGEGVEGDADEHPDDAEADFDVGVGRVVAVADGRQRDEAEVQAREVDLEVGGVDELVAVDPREGHVGLDHADRAPDAGGEVQHEDGDDAEDDGLDEATVYADEIGEAVAFLDALELEQFRDLSHLHETRQLEQTEKLVEGR